MDKVVLMLLVLLSLLVLFLLLLAAFARAPIFLSCVAALCYLLLHFVSDERSGVHRAQEFENRFWTAFACLCSTAALFAADSPLAFGLWSPSLGFLTVLASGAAMHCYDRMRHRAAIGRSVSFLARRPGALPYGGVSSGGRGPVRRAVAPVPPPADLEETLAEINAALSAIDRNILPSTINNMVRSKATMRNEARIIRLFQECRRETLNGVIPRLRLGLLFYKVKDHRRIDGFNRTQLIETLAVNRVAHLTVLSRAIVLDGMQQLKLSANVRGDCWVQNIILSTKQDDLSELKTLSDTKGDYYTMHKLVYRDIVSDVVRGRILAHFRTQAGVQASHAAMKTTRGRIRAQRPWRKILSDIDDTLLAGGGFPAGMDKRYGKKVLYPGVLAFYKELDLGVTGPDEWQDGYLGNLTFLSARPHVYKDVLQKKSFEKFARMRERGMHTNASLLAGDLSSGREFMVKNDFGPMAEKKAQNFREFASIYPEYSYVFVGDNGQGDLRAGEMMYEAVGPKFEALYVHVVQEHTKAFGYDPLRWAANGLDKRLCFFRTYPQAALHACRTGLIRPVGLRRVCEAAVRDFKFITPKKWPSARHRLDRHAELNQDIWEANVYLEGIGVSPSGYVPAERLWQDGHPVRTPYGLAVVKSFDSDRNSYEVELDWRPLDVQLEEHAGRQYDRLVTRMDLSPEAVARAGEKKGRMECIVEIPELESDGEGDRPNLPARGSFEDDFLSTQISPDAAVAASGAPPSVKLKMYPYRGAQFSCKQNLEILKGIAWKVESNDWTKKPPRFEALAL